jgi:ribonuclease Y
MAHHGDVEPISPYAPIVAAADAISGSRPGARRESIEKYIQRIQRLEEIAYEHKGVEKAFAIQAGRELRVIVDANKVSDTEAFEIARSISKKIEEELQFPGQIKVVVIRETRAIEYAR